VETLKSKFTLPRKEPAEDDRLSDRTPSSIRVICSDESFTSVNSHESDVMDEFGAADPILKMNNTKGDLHKLKTILILKSLEMMKGLHKIKIMI
jgi:hypothetical protein